MYENRYKYIWIHKKNIQVKILKQTLSNHACQQHDLRRGKIYIFMHTHIFIYTYVCVCMSICVWKTHFIFVRWYTIASYIITVRKRLIILIDLLEMIKTNDWEFLRNIEDLFPRLVKIWPLSWQHIIRK